jgi:hypothetical protein
MQHDYSKDMSVHISTCFQHISTSYMEVVMLIRWVFLCLVTKMSDQFLEQ